MDNGGRKSSRRRPPADSSKVTVNVFDHYSVKQRIGSGSFAQVYLGINPESAEYVAVKRITLQSPDQLPPSLRSEISTLRKISHYHVVGFIRAFIDDFSVYLITEYCALKDLTGVLADRHKAPRDIVEPEIRYMFSEYPSPPRSYPDASQLPDYRRGSKEHFGGLHEVLTHHFGKQIMNALRYLHQNNISHRDIKPHNILLTPSKLSKCLRQSPDQDVAALVRELAESNPGATGLSWLPVVKLADFGFATRHSPELMSTTLCGSPLYMDPEILGDEREYDSKLSDVWSLGVVLFQLAVGVTPFTAGNHVALLKNIERQNDHIYYFGVEVSDDLKNLLNSSLKRSPVNRIDPTKVAEHPFFTQRIPDLNSGDEVYEIPYNRTTAKERRPSTPRSWTVPDSTAARYSQPPSRTPSFKHSRPALHSDPQNGGGPVPPKPRPGHAYARPPSPPPAISRRNSARAEDNGNLSGDNDEYFVIGDQEVASIEDHDGYSNRTKSLLRLGRFTRRSDSTGTGPLPSPRINPAAVPPTPQTATAATATATAAAPARPPSRPTSATRPVVPVPRHDSQTSPTHVPHSPSRNPNQHKRTSSYARTVYAARPNSSASDLSNTLKKATQLQIQFGRNTGGVPLNGFNPHSDPKPESPEQQDVPRSPDATKTSASAAFSHIFDLYHRGLEVFRFGDVKLRQLDLAVAPKEGESHDAALTTDAYVEASEEGIVLYVMASQIFGRTLKLIKEWTDGVSDPADKGEHGVRIGTRDRSGPTFSGPVSYSERVHILTINEKARSGFNKSMSFVERLRMYLCQRRHGPAAYDITNNVCCRECQNTPIRANANVLLYDYAIKRAERMIINTAVAADGKGAQQLWRNIISLFEAAIDVGEDDEVDDESPERAGQVRCPPGINSDSVMVVRQFVENAKSWRQKLKRESSE